MSRFDSAYAGRDVVNQAAKVAPGVIKGAANDINNMAKQRIDQIISQGGKEIECVLPKFLEELWKMSIKHCLGYLGTLENSN